MQCPLCPLFKCWSLCKTFPKTHTGHTSKVHILFTWNLQNVFFTNFLVVTHNCVMYVGGVMPIFNIASKVNVSYLHGIYIFNHSGFSMSWTGFKCSFFLHERSLYRVICHHFHNMFYVTYLYLNIIYLSIQSITWN